MQYILEKSFAPIISITVQYVDSCLLRSRYLHIVQIVLCFPTRLITRIIPGFEQKRVIPLSE